MDKVQCFILTSIDYSSRKLREERANSSQIRLEKLSSSGNRDKIAFIESSNSIWTESRPAAASDHVSQQTFSVLI